MLKFVAFLILHNIALEINECDSSLKTLNYWPEVLGDLSIVELHFQHILLFDFKVQKPFALWTVIHYLGLYRK